MPVTSSDIGKGTVLHWERFEFETGERKNSLLLILTSCLSNSYLAIRATTKTELYERPDTSLNLEFLLLQPEQEVAFKQKTVLDLNRITILHFDKIKDGWDNSVKKTSPASMKLLLELDKKVNASRVISMRWKEWIRNS